MKHICPVCGYGNLSQPAYFDNGRPTYETCSSCFFEFGYDDDAVGITHEQWRQKWIAEGMPWRGHAKEPPHWNPKKQLENIGIYL